LNYRGDKNILTIFSFVDNVFYVKMKYKNLSLRSRTLILPELRTFRNAKEP